VATLVNAETYPANRNIPICPSGAAGTLSSNGGLFVFALIGVIFA
jgi:hypothetical protein